VFELNNEDGDIVLVRSAGLLYIIVGRYSKSQFIQITCITRRFCTNLLCSAITHAHVRARSFLISVECTYAEM